MRPVSKPSRGQAAAERGLALFAGSMLCLTTACTSDLRDALTSSSHASSDAEADAGSVDCPEGSYGSGSSVDACMPCPVGTFCEEGTTEPTPCVAGTWDDDADPATRCQRWTNCQVGEYVMQDGSASGDQGCAVCALGTFSAEANTSQCTAWTVCEAGSYVRVAGTARLDLVCEPCAEGTFSAEENLDECEDWSECAPGQFVEAEGSNTLDRRCGECADGESSSVANAEACVPNGMCEAGTTQLTPGTDSAPPECAECEVGQYCAGGENPAENCGATEWDDDADPATSCVAHRECPVGGYVFAPGTAVVDQSCEDCAEGTFSGAVDSRDCTAHQVCPVGSFVETPGTSSSDAECAGCESGSYAADEGSESCTPWTDCQPGEFVVAVGDASTDRQCEACPPDTYSAGLNSGACAEVGECAAGTVQITPSDETNPAECEDCIPGEYCAGGEVEIVMCGGATWDDDENPATPCAAKTSCVAGQYVVLSGDALTDQTCAPCAASEFTDAVDASACQVWQTCTPGSFVATPGTNTSDQVCAACSAGTFSTETDVTSCTPWANCAAPSFYASTEPSPSNDRVCGSCVAPEETLADNASECILPTFQMSDGTVVMEAEHYHVQERNGSNHAWEQSAVASASGGACMDINPDVAYTWTNPVGFAPRLDFRVNFSATGTFYIHLRGDPGASGGGSDSVFSAVDTTILPEYDFDDAANAWGWRHSRSTSPPPVPTR